MDASAKLENTRHREVEEQDRTVREQKAAITQLKSAVAKQEATIAQQQKGMEILTASLKEQASQIRKVNAQLELSKAVSQLVSNRISQSGALKPREP